MPSTGTKVHRPRVPCESAARLLCSSRSSESLGLHLQKWMLNVQKMGIWMDMDGYGAMNLQNHGIFNLQFSWRDGWWWIPTYYSSNIFGMWTAKRVKCISISSQKSSQRVCRWGPFLVCISDMSEWTNRLVHVCTDTDICMCLSMYLHILMCN